MVDSINWTSKGVEIYCAHHLQDKMNADKDGYIVRQEF